MLLNRLRHSIQLLRTLVRGPNGFIDERFGIACRARAALSEISNLIGNDGKTHSRRSGARRFHGGIQGEYVGLERSRQSL